MGLAALFLALALAAAPPEAGTAPAGGGSPLYTELRGAAPRSPLPDLTRIVKGAMPAVVGVVTTAPPEPGKGPRGPGAPNDLFDRNHGGTPRKGLGTGFVIHRDGWILTNAHVVEGAAEVEVDLGEEGQRLPARVVGADAPTDVALLKIEPPEPLPVVPLGDSDRVEIAEWALVLGNPFGLSHSVTFGIVSHTGRDDVSPAGRDGFYDFIQTDASINPGNSGGPVLNLRGEVVGIATAVNATGQGIGFAVPINMAKEIVGQLREHGKVVRSWLGVSVREVSRDLALAAGLGASRGVMVTGVAAGGPAAQAGLRVGDLITGFGGQAVRTAARLRWQVATAGVGRRVSLQIRRGPGEERALAVDLTLAPAGEVLAGSPEGSTPDPGGAGTASGGD
ncbi:MAG TPA: trypsin-like peptidase domain-containing protein [Anaeromyxobacteraceae bacterium]|jgi:serine protease Do|nr:trypsin-like peptidase domain-containing protein [Anaeromyxobacteraceae bacterium]